MKKTATFSWYKEQGQKGYDICADSKDDRNGHLLDTGNCCIEARHSMGQLMEDVLPDHDRIIHDNSQRHDEAKYRDHIHTGIHHRQENE